MENEADRIIKGILRAEDDFLIEVGRLTLLFSEIEDALVIEARLLALLIDDADLKRQAESPELLQGRVLDKRDFLKKMFAEVARYYRVDAGRVLRVLDELGNLQKMRRTVVHGWIRWSAIDGAPVFVDSRGATQSAWPEDVMALSEDVLGWRSRLSKEEQALMAGVKQSFLQLFDRLSSLKRLPPALLARVNELRERLEGPV